MKDYSLFILFCLSMLAISCTDTTADTPQSERDDSIILQYLGEQNITDYQKTSSGIYYTYSVEKPTNLAIPENTIVNIAYEGKLMYGDIFDSSYLRGDSLRLQSLSGGIVDYTETDSAACINVSGSVISGWIEAIRILKEGEKGRFYLPSATAYGLRGSGTSIPPNANLIFDIEVLSTDIMLSDTSRTTCQFRDRL